MKRAYATLAAVGIVVLVLSLIQCAQDADTDAPQSTRQKEEHSPMEYVLGDDWGRADGSASNLRFQTPDGQVTFSYGLNILIERTADSSHTALQIKWELINAVRLELHTATKGEVQTGDLVKVTVEGQFPGSPLEAAGVFDGLIDSQQHYQVNAPAREYLEDFFSDRGAIRLFTVTERERS